ncbi:MAG: hypothetical protein A2W52_02100 [Candidatus Taylorbacteria bacterium RIFCSPHIGHO2_02_49_25]|uniref:Prepilin-type N-terminal cleavage/methylation domain-containing protein n=1 Tax=Candidatus Taylorbacteria bacterium RIFCSPHIGHO2_02_49_25 TaxID=1802305 RepID=A0A1G2MJZ8_9BACT|nr:MAG: hypothetical protein UY62_C0044G0004 [Parcubacteria group bacterium GW2011_GWF2_50_9]OHA20642.1 MAG: hypothetical protein A2759_01310 [Candidatus Taylorbacteria bacterium RIFCSPHIGHO2_01_FULL_49_60]OHA23499.1 MAG: hypothetical protein A2W52_02100 [Candidatus Taylorbacteria bacterium RIFCSPHIGHO2_02_49_25]OHA36322.1 MAG: hypothetical protein A3B27_01345 [Candidatus Taylorbacteria bacterium RIFCSPLOWO2_01_FULL_50_130]OHA36852.1 MAG: hypothetical protein A2W65_00090 [Candidatus Taylorbacte
MNYGKERNLRGLRHNSVLIIHNSSHGFSLVEVLLYVIILSFALLALLQTLLVITNSYRALKNTERLEQDAIVALERFFREARDGYALDDAGSIYNAYPGKLLIRSTDVNGLPKTVEFYLDAGKLSVKENGVVAGLLTSPGASVSNLVFRKISTVRSRGVKIEMTIVSGTSTAARTGNFYATAVLRDSY